MNSNDPVNPSRKIKQVFQGKPTLEGAGVHLKRAFGFNEVPLFDPFLLFDDFRSDIPEHFIKGFPFHPHRGIETITYVLKGDVEHKDSLGNQGTIGSGDVQWMTAGSGIIHQEMPKGDKEGRMHGFQLWANLPARLKMMDPRYRDITRDSIPEVTLENHTVIKVVAGKVAGVKGPVDDIVIAPEYLDVAVPPNTRFSHPTQPGHTVFAYVIDGKGLFGEEETEMGNGSLVLFGHGASVNIFALNTGARFLLISGKPLGEPVAWHGPIVMNTQEELETAFDEYSRGTFIRFRPNPSQPI
jgi:redox-sensitive bicupin YhaK (pirin superfamily)